MPSPANETEHSMNEAKKYTHKEIRELLVIAEKIKQGRAVLPSEADRICSFKLEDTKSKLQNFLLKIALPGSVVLGMTQAAFPSWYTGLVTHMPGWTNMSTNLLNAVDYVWGIIGKPVKQNNIIYHVPNIILYSFGVIGVKKLFEFVRRKTWLDKVTEAKEILDKKIEKGTLPYQLRTNHSILFIGRGDFIGEQFCINSHCDDAVTLSSIKPNYTTHWIKYDITSSYTNLEKTLLQADAESAGEYILFPVKDTELFLPGEREYDIAPEKVEVLIHTLRDVERQHNWEANRIIIVGDRKQITSIRTENKKSVLENTVENISLMSIDKEMRKVTIIDASDLVVKEILKRYPGRKILFRSSVDGSNVYKKRFFERLEEFGYNDEIETNLSVVIGYDMYEEQIERETIRTRLQEYLPIVLSKDVHDAILRNGFTKDQFIYVPDIVLANLRTVAELN